MNALPSDMESAINSFNMFAPDLPITAAIAMREYIKAETEDDEQPHTGVMVTFDKCGVVFVYEDQDEDGEIDPRIKVLICPLSEHKKVKFPCSTRFHDEYTDDGLIRLINKCKPLIEHIEAHGFCACGEDEWPVRVKRVKLTGLDICGKCAFKAALSP